MIFPPASVDATTGARFVGMTVLQRGMPCPIRNGGLFDRNNLSTRLPGEARQIISIDELFRVGQRKRRAENTAMQTISAQWPEEASRLPDRVDEEHRPV